MSSWKRKSYYSYDSLRKNWISWCTEWDFDPISGPIKGTVNFLVHLHTKGYQYCLLGCYKSAIAFIHTPVDGFSKGQHPLIFRLLKSAFHLQPPLVHYSGTWDILRVFVYLNSRNLEDTNLPLKLLTLCGVMLLALTCPLRSADLTKLSLMGFRMTPEGVMFLSIALSKQSSLGRVVKEFFFP